MLWLGKFVLLMWAALLGAWIWQKNSPIASLQEEGGSPA
jgi:hypothetical protein